MGAQNSIKKENHENEWENIQEKNNSEQSNNSIDSKKITDDKKEKNEDIIPCEDEYLDNKYINIINKEKYISKDDALIFSKVGTQNNIPWVYKNQNNNTPAIIRLHNEIINYVNYISLSENERQIREDVIRKSYLFRFKEEIVNAFPGVDIKVYGSFCTGLCTKKSDIDLSVEIDSINSKSISLRSIYQVLIKSTLCAQATLIEEASVPIIKLIEKSQQIHFDFSINAYDGIKAASVIKDVIKRFPHFRYLTIFLKDFLKKRKNNETYYEGVGSHLLNVLVIRYLQYKYKILQEVKNFNLGTALIDLFTFYGRQFNNKKVGINIHKEGFFFKRPFECLEGISVINPINLNQDIGKFIDWNLIKDTFNIARDILLFGENDTNSILGKIINTK